MSIYKGLRYYKYVYEDWTQPVLTANGTMGGDSFAVSASSTHSSVQPYYAFNGVIGAYTTGWTAKVTDAYLQFYSPQPLKISKLTIKNVPTNSSAVGYVTGYSIKASNNPDGDYVDIISGTNDVGYDGIWDINITTSEAYKYWRFYVNSWNNIEWFSISELTITAQEQITVESTKDDYDYAVPIKIKDSGRGVFIGSKNTNCLTHTPKHVDVELNPLNVNVTGTWGVIADGVAKGFTAANYLTLPEVFNPESNPWEIVIKARTPSAFSKRNWLTGGGKATGKDYDFVSMGLESNGKPLLYITSNGTSWNIASAAVSSNTLAVNTAYLFRCQFTGTQYIYSTSVDNGSTWVTQITINSTTNIFVPTTPQAIGTSCYQANAPQFWVGSIDLSQSYININGERWWSGDSYNKVGSWIENGVVGSFTTANYVTLTEVLPLSTSSNVETVIKAKTSSATGSQVIIANTTDAPSGGGFVVRTDSGSRLYCWGTTNNSSWSITKADTGIDLTTEDKYIKIIYTPTLISFSESIDGVTWNDGQSITIAGFSDTTPRLGLSGTKYPFLGTIDLTQSYIKINDEIWWQGGTGDVTLKAGSKVFIPNGFSDYDYYKYVYQDWTQPTISGYGTMGGDSFAVAASSTYSGDHAAWKAFIGGEWESSNSIKPPHWIAFYNPTRLKVTKISLRNANNSYLKTAIFQGSNNYENWDDIQEITNTVGLNAAWSVDIDNDKSYLYHRLYITSTSNGTYVDLANIVITAQEVVGAELSTPDDYDYTIGKGNKLFNEVVINSDVICARYNNNQQLHFYNPANNLIEIPASIYSGIPTDGCIWFDTANNIIKKNVKGAWDNSGYSLPFCIATTNDVSYTSIDEVFDWCGRIGNTAFVLPDVKGFIAKGWTDTGTYNSTEFTVNKVLTADIDAVTDRSLLLGSDKLDYTECNYNKVDNLLYNTDGEVINAVECGKVTSDGTAITSLTPYETQPLTTTLSIRAIYSGSQLVYVWQPYEPDAVILYGANTGAKTYILDNGVYQCCVVGGGIQGNYWSKAGGAAVEIQFRLTEKATVVIYSGGGSSTGYIDIDGVRIAQAGGARGQNDGGLYSIDTASPYYVSTIVARNGGGANMSTAGSVSPYGGWGAGGQNGGARLAYVGVEIT